MFFTYKINISVVTMFTINPRIVIRLGANHNGTFDVNQFQQGCSNLSHMLLLLHEYLCSLNFRNCTSESSLCLYNFILRSKETALTLGDEHLLRVHLFLWCLATVLCTSGRESFAMISRFCYLHRVMVKFHETRCIWCDFHWQDDVGNGAADDRQI